MPAFRSAFDWRFFVRRTTSLPSAAEIELVTGEPRDARVGNLVSQILDAG